MKKPDLLCPLARCLGLNHMRYEDLDTCQIVGGVIVGVGFAAIIGLVVLSFVLRWLS